MFSGADEIRKIRFVDKADDNKRRECEDKIDEIIDFTAGLNASRMIELLDIIKKEKDEGFAKFSRSETLGASNWKSWINKHYLSADEKMFVIYGCFTRSIDIKGKIYHYKRAIE